MTSAQRASILRRRRARAAAAAIAACVAWPTTGTAKTMQVVSRAADLPLEVLTRLCDRGLLALVESHADGSSRQVVLFAHLNAPPDRVYDVLMDVEAYPRFVSTIDSVRIIGRRRGMMAFKWALDLPLFGLDGTRLQRGRRPTLIESRGAAGDLRGTRERWELYPTPNGTLVAFYRALDIETGGFLLRTLVDLEPSTEAGANLSSGFIHLRGLQRHLSGAPANEPAPRRHNGPVPAFSRLDLKTEAPLTALLPMLKHGLFAVIESHDDGALRQVTLLGRSKVAPKRLHDVVAHAEAYPEFMPNISRQRVTRRDDGTIHLDWTIKTPVSSMSGTALMTVGTDTIEVNALSGDVDRARILWHIAPVPPAPVSSAPSRGQGDAAGPAKAPRPSDAAGSIVSYYAYSDIRAASWVTRMLLNAEPLLEHGMVGAAGTVALTAMTARAEGRR